MNMQKIYADLHIHIGSSRGQAVKVTASRDLTLEQVLFRDAPAVGLQVAGVVDAACAGVFSEIEELIENGRLFEQIGGGLLADNGMVLIPACEFESREGAHFIAYLPGLNALRQWQGFIHPRLSNSRLSTQRVRTGLKDAFHACSDCGGIFCPAHAFTPHKGYYGAVAPSLADCLGSEAGDIKVVELGLSADTRLASRIAETDQLMFISNSDAHSSKNVGREFNLLEVECADFEGLRKAITGQGPGRIVANYGFNPLLGKYHRTSCPECGTICTEAEAADCCVSCGNIKVVMGVYDRILMIADRDADSSAVIRPPYRYRVPLHELPGIGPKALRALLAEHQALQVMEELAIGEIEAIAGARAAAGVAALRAGSYRIEAGGGGKYGRIKLD